MWAARPHLRVIANPAPAGARAGASSDVGLLAFLFVLHVVPAAAYVAGRSWGPGTAGYASLVAILSGRELVREIRRALA